MNELIPRRADYTKLLSYRKSDAIFRITDYFCRNYISIRDRTYDQMIQAARSGKQNIVEGVCAAPTSAKTEIKLIGVAKASLAELLEDYRDFLNTRGFAQWEPGSIEFEAMRKLGREQNDAAFYMELIQTRPPHTIANIAIILIRQTDYLLFRHLERLEKDFLRQGGFTERLYALRRRERGY